MLSMAYTIICDRGILCITVVFCVYHDIPRTADKGRRGRFECFHNSDTHFVCRPCAAYSCSAAKTVYCFHPLFHARWTTVRGVTPSANRPVSVCSGICAVVRFVGRWNSLFFFRPFSGVPANSKMSKADQLLAKLPPATQLPSFVTDALNGKRRPRSTRSSRRCRYLLFFVFVLCRFQNPCAAVQPRAKRHEHDWSKLPHSYVFVSTLNCNKCHGTLKPPPVCSPRPVITSRNEEVLDSTPASPGNESDKTSVKGAEQASGKGDLFNWMKGSSSSIFSMVAEKAKHSVDAVLTTLDPQMKDSLNRK